MKKQDFDNLVESIKQAGKIRRGEMKAIRTFQFGPIDIRNIRLRLKKSQSEFAMMIGVSVSTLQNWEQGRRRPEGPARALLKIAAGTPCLLVNRRTWSGGRLISCARLVHPGNLYRLNSRSIIGLVTP